MMVVSDEGKDAVADEGCNPTVARSLPYSQAPGAFLVEVAPCARRTVTITLGPDATWGDYFAAVKAACDEQPWEPDGWVTVRARKLDDEPTCEHDWWLPDPGGEHTPERPWLLWCRLCEERTPVCILCMGRPRVDGSSWCAVCRPRVRASLGTFEEMLADPLLQVDVDGIVYKNVVDATVALPFKPGAEGRPT